MIFFLSVQRSIYEKENQVFSRLNLIISKNYSRYKRKKMILEYFMEDQMTNWSTLKLIVEFQNRVTLSYPFSTV